MTRRFEQKYHMALIRQDSHSSSDKLIFKICINLPFTTCLEIRYKYISIIRLGCKPLEFPVNSDTILQCTFGRQFSCVVSNDFWLTLICCKETQTVQTSGLTDILYMYELRVAFFRRLQNSPYFLRIHDARTVKQKVWSEACETRAVRARVALSLLLRYTKPILRKITTVL